MVSYARLVFYHQWVDFELVELVIIWYTQQTAIDLSMAEIILDWHADALNETFVDRIYQYNRSYFLQNHMIHVINSSLI